MRGGRGLTKQKKTKQIKKKKRQYGDKFSGISGTFLEGASGVRGNAVTSGQRSLRVAVSRQREYLRGFF